MKSRNARIFLVLSLVALSSLLAASMTTAEAPAAPLAAPPAVQPDMALPPTSTTPGIYMAFVDWLGEDPAIYDHEGEFVVFNWNRLEYGRGDYNMGTIEAWVARKALQGKRAAFSISAYNGRSSGGIAVPDYLKNNPNAVVDVGGGWLIPKYWSPDYLQAYEGLVQKIALTFRGDPRIEFIALGTGMYGEAWACDPGADSSALAAAGLDSDVWIDAVQDMTAGWYRWFRGTEPELQTTLFQQVAPVTYSATERREISQYSAERGIGLSVNGLYPQQGGAVVSGGSQIGSGMYDGILTWWQEVPIAWETYHYMLCDPKELYWGTISGLDKHPDYMRLARDLFIDEDGDARTEFLQVFDWVSQYVGVTVENTPSVWVAMREPQHPWRTCWDSNALKDNLEYGNFSFWLDQDDGIEEGMTVPETNAQFNRQGEAVEWIRNPSNPNPYNPDLPAPDPAKPLWQYTHEDWELSRSGWVIRRTDQETGNPYMWLKVDDGYINGEWNSVAISVTYADIFTDTWSLEYEAIGGVLKAATPQGSSAPWVQKTDSSTYKTVTFFIDDARLGNGLEGEADFRINCNDDGDDWIHFVELELLSTQPEPTPTPTHTPTPTPTLTPTPTPTPTTGWIRGIVWEDQDQNGVREEGEPGLPGVEVTLKTLAMATIMTRTTATDGTFEFSGVLPGDYWVEQTPIPGYALSKPPNINFQGVTVFANEVQWVEFGDYRLPTPTPTATNTPTPTDTPTPTPTATDTPTPTVTPTATPSIRTTYLPLITR